MNLEPQNQVRGLAASREVAVRHGAAIDAEARRAVLFLVRPDYFVDFAARK